MSSDKIIQRIEETLRDAFDNLSSRIKFGQRDFTYKIGRRICKVAEDNILLSNTVLRNIRYIWLPKMER